MSWSLITSCTVWDEGWETDSSTSGIMFSLMQFSICSPFVLLSRRKRHVPYKFYFKLESKATGGINTLISHVCNIACVTYMNVTPRLFRVSFIFLPFDPASGKVYLQVRLYCRFLRPMNLLGSLFLFDFFSSFEFAFNREEKTGKKYINDDTRL